MFSDFFSSQVCNICVLLKAENEYLLYKANRAKKLFKCNGCKLISYCGQSHQQLDWIEHKPFCYAISSIITSFGVNHPLEIFDNINSKTKLQNCLLRLKFMVTKILKRSLQFHEEELLSFPAVCNICFKFKSVKPCETCAAVSYCSSVHASEDHVNHQRFCSSLDLYYCPFKVQIINEEEKDEADKKRLTFKRNPNLLDHNLIECYEYISGIKIPEKPNKSKQNYEIFHKAAQFTWLLTICYIIALLKIYETKEKLSIFIVGATVERIIMQKAGIEFLFIQNPGLIEVHFYFVGPDTVPGETEINFFYNKKNEKRKVCYRSYPGARIEDFVEKSAADLVFAFNCGFSEHPCANNSNVDKNLNNKKNIENAWYDGIKSLLSWPNVPITFTSYTLKESQFDNNAFTNVLKTMQNSSSVSVKAIISNQRNPYSDILPLRNLYIDDDEVIYYRNNYINCVRLENSCHKDVSN